MAKRKYYEGQVIDGKIVKEVHRGTDYIIFFTDGSYVVKKLNE